jgi:hexulose-6-phosphate isomerase
MSGFDRRELMLLAGAASLARFAPAAAAATPVTMGPGHGLKKALKIGMIQVEGSLEDKFRAAQVAGFDGVELDSPSGLDPEEVLAAKEAVGIEIPGVVDSRHWQDSLGDPDPAVRAKGRAALETAIHDCKRYGGTTVLLVPAVVNERISYGDAYRRSQEELRRVLPLAAEQEITIAFENVWNNFLLSPVEAARYIDELESPWVGWYLDVGNLVRFAWPEHWVRELGNRIVKLDIKEYSRKKQNDEGLWKGFAVEIGEGDCGWPRVMAALKEIGYTKGWAAAEVSGGGPERLQDIAERMDRVLAS